MNSQDLPSSHIATVVKGNIATSRALMANPSVNFKMIGHETGTNFDSNDQDVVCSESVNEGAVDLDMLEAYAVVNEKINGKTDWICLS